MLKEKLEETERGRKVIVLLHAVFQEVQEQTFRSDPTILLVLLMLLILLISISTNFGGPVHTHRSHVSRDGPACFFPVDDHFAKLSGAVGLPVDWDECKWTPI
jgi:hypothetical protein